MKNPSQQDQLNVKSAQYKNTPQNVIYNAARFNKEFLNSQIGGRPVTVSIGTMLTVMGDKIYHKSTIKNIRARL